MFLDKILYIETFYRKKFSSRSRELLYVACTIYLHQESSTLRIVGRVYRTDLFKEVEKPPSRSLPQAGVFAIDRQH